MTASTFSKNKSSNTILMCWLGAGVLTLLCMLPTASFALSQNPPSAPGAVQDIRLRHISSSDTHSIGKVEIKASLRYGNSGVFDPDRVQEGDWTGITFVIINHASKRFLFNDQFVRIDLEGGGHVTADQSDTMHGTPFVTTLVEPGARQIVTLGPYGWRLPVKDITYRQNNHRLEWKCSPDKAKHVTVSMRIPAVHLHYSINDLGTLGGSASGALAINDHGDIVGWAETPAGKDGQHRHAILWRNGSMVDIGEGEANAINQIGQVVGRLENKAFLYQNGKVQLLQTSEVNSGEEAHNEASNQDRSNAVAINDKGQIAGWTSGAHSVISWVWQDRQVHCFPDAIVMDINNKGHLVGQWKSHPGLYADGKWRDLGTLGGERGIASYINADDEVSGSADTAELYDTGDDRAGSYAPLAAPFVWRNSKMTRLSEQWGAHWKGEPTAVNNGKFFRVFPYVPDGTGGLRHFTQLLPTSSKWTNLRASAINRKGQIVGVGKINNIWRAFLMSPIDSAATLDTK